MELILPGPACEASYRQAIEEYARAGLSPTCFFGGAERCPDGLFARFADYRAGQNLPAGYVPCTSLWLVDGDEFLAEVSIRHRLTPARSALAATSATPCGRATGGRGWARGCWRARWTTPAGSWPFPGCC